MNAGAVPIARQRPAAGVSPRVEWGATLLLAVLAFFAFRASPVHMMLDSKYTLLASEVLWRERTFELTKHVPGGVGAQLEAQRQERSSKTHWQLRLLDGRLLCFYPPGSAILSIPAVLAMNAAGHSATGPNGIYSLAGERAMQIRLAALLTAITVVLCVRIAQRELPFLPALAIGVVAAFGTALWSTASRILWMQTWGVLLAAAALLELLRWDDGERRRPVWLGALLVAAFWVRPTNGTLAGLAALYVLARHRRAFLPLALTGAVGAAGYYAYSIVIWGGAGNGYLRATHYLGRGTIVEGIRGLLVDPTRGVLVFSPFLAVAMLVLLRLGIRRERRPFALLGGLWVLSLLWIYGDSRAWWGAGSVGYRYLTELCPLFAWLAAHAWRRQREESPRLGLAWRAGIATLAAVTVAASALAHSTGAFDYDGSAARRGLYPPWKARGATRAGLPRIPYLQAIPQRIPLAYWGILERFPAQDGEDEPES
jgi:hypothetical protein